MLWIIIILSIIGAIIYGYVRDFNSSTETQKREIDEQGGMAAKYHTLIDNLLFTENARISELKRDSIDIMANYHDETNTFIIMHLWGEVRIICKANGVMGESTKVWNFPEILDQEVMAIRVLRDMNSKRANAISEKKLASFEKRNPHIAKGKPIEFETKPKQPLVEPIVMCDECDDRGYVYCCDNCGGSISFVERNEDFYEYCGNCSKGSHVDIVTRPCACRNQF